MKNDRDMKRNVYAALLALTLVLAGIARAGAQHTEDGSAGTADVPKVYIFHEISSENLVKIYRVLEIGRASCRERV